MDMINDKINVVQVKYGNNAANLYTLRVPDDWTLNTGDVVMTNFDNSSIVGMCVTASEMVSRNVLTMINRKGLTQGEVIGKYTLTKFFEGSYR